jgi:hypothetical protein
VVTAAFEPPFLLCFARMAGGAAATPNNGSGYNEHIVWQVAERAKVWRARPRAGQVVVVLAECVGGKLWPDSLF